MARLTRRSKLPVDTHSEGDELPKAKRGKPKLKALKKLPIDSDSDEDVPLAKKATKAESKGTKHEVHHEGGHETDDSPAFKSRVVTLKPKAVKDEAPSLPSSLRHSLEVGANSTGSMKSFPPPKPQLEGLTDASPLVQAGEKIAARTMMQKERATEFEAETEERRAVSREQKEAGGGATAVTHTWKITFEDDREDSISSPSTSPASPEAPTSMDIDGEGVTPKASEDDSKKLTEASAQEIDAMNEVEKKEETATAAMEVGDETEDETQKHVQVGASNNATEKAAAQNTVEEQMHIEPTLAENVFDVVKATNRVSVNA